MLRGKLFKPRTLLLGAAALVVAGASAADAWVNVMQARAPELALAVDGNDPEALVRQIELQVAQGEDTGDRLEAVARQSVDAQPINAPAFRLFSLVNSGDSDVETIRRRMELSDRMSRRDTGAQLWLIEDAVARNNISDALYHYDIAMRIQRSSREILFPILAQALKEPAIRARFAPYMQADNPWLESFIRFALAATDDPSAYADLAQRSGGFPEGPEFAGFDTQILRALVKEGKFRRAVAYFGSLDAEPGLLTSLDLRGASTAEAIAPVSWQPYSIPGIEPMVLASDNGNVEIESRIDAGFAGPFIRKMLALKPGTYRMEMDLRGEDFMSADAANFKLLCAGSVSGPDSLVDASRPLEGTISLVETFAVPPSCPVQMLTVSVRAGFGGGSKTLTLLSADLERMSKRPAD